VLSPLAAEATGLRHGQEVWIAREPAEWLAAIEHLCRDAEAWHACSAAAHRYARATWSRERGLDLMAAALERLHLPVQQPGATP
jgi:hypothetical protein